MQSVRPISFPPPARFRVKARPTRRRLLKQQRSKLFPAHKLKSLGWFGNSNKDAMSSSIVSTRYKACIVSNRRGHSTFFQTSARCWVERPPERHLLPLATLPFTSSKKPNG